MWFLIRQKITVLTFLILTSKIQTKSNFLFITISIFENLSILTTIYRAYSHAQKIKKHIKINTFIFHIDHAPFRT